MKLAPEDLNDLALERLGVEAASLISAGSLHSLHAQFGYALAFNRDPIEALAEDVAATLAEVGASGFGDPSQSCAKVKHFEPNEIGLSRLVECLLPTNNGKHLLVELVVSATGSEAHLTLEQVSATA